MFEHEHEVKSVLTRRIDTGGGKQRVSEPLAPVHGEQQLQQDCRNIRRDGDTNECSRIHRYVAFSTRTKRSENANSETDRHTYGRCRDAQSRTVSNRIFQFRPHFTAALDAIWPVKRDEVLKPTEIASDVVGTETIEFFVLRNLRTCCAGIRSHIASKRIGAHPEGDIHQKCNEQQSWYCPCRATKCKPKHICPPLALILLNQIELHYADGAQPEPKGPSRAPYMRTSD